MANTHKQLLAWALGTLLWACTDSPKPEIPPGAYAEERHKTSTPTISQQDQALAVGDSIVRYAEGAFLQLAESRPQAQALFVAQPDKLPAVQVLLQRYQAQLERRALSKKEERQWNRVGTLFGQRASLQATVQETSSFFVYQRPMQVMRRNCASCEEPSLLNFMAQDVDQLRVFSTQGKPQGYEVGTVTGVWVIRFPKNTPQQ